MFSKALTPWITWVRSYAPTTWLSTSHRQSTSPHNIQWLWRNTFILWSSHTTLAKLEYCIVLTMDHTDTWRWKSQYASRICQLPKDVTANFTATMQARKINEIKKGDIFRCWKYIFPDQTRYLIIVSSGKVRSNDWQYQRKSHIIMHTIGQTGYSNYKPNFRLMWLEA